MTTRQHILVVEDEEHLATGIKHHLEAEGYLATTVGDGPSALKFIEHNPDDANACIQAWGRRQPAGGAAGVHLGAADK